MGQKGFYLLPWSSSSPVRSSCGGLSPSEMVLPHHPQTLRHPFSFPYCRTGAFGSINSTSSAHEVMIRRVRNSPAILCSSTSSSDSITPSSTTVVGVMPTTTAPPPMNRRKRYRKLLPGESKGITEEMRFVAMKLRNNKGKSENSDDDDGGDTWQPTMEGFLKFLVDSKLVFSTVERIVDESDHVAYAYFRRTGLERSQGLTKDLEWFNQQDIDVPQPSTPGVSYAKYLEELAEESAPLFLSHVYNIYFSHLAGGQVIAKQVSDKLLNGRELEFCRWDGDAQELLKGAREKLNMLGEHWSRQEKNRCLREASKSFNYLGQIVRLIIL